MFSVMWSEHCSNKNTKRELRKFPTTGPLVLVKAGEENAGVIHIGDGWAVAFKMESRNHPSAVKVAIIAPRDAVARKVHHAEQ